MCVCVCAVLRPLYTHFQFPSDTEVLRIEENQTYHQPHLKLKVVIIKLPDVVFKNLAHVAALWFSMGSPK